MGGGYSGAAGEILIDGGMIEARSFQEGAGIGSGFQGAGGTITINSGRVFAHTTRADGTGTSATVGNPAAIGGARGSGSGVINISGGVVVADTGDASSAGIGGGFGQTTGEINISGGVVISYGGVGVNASNDDMGARITTRISGNAMVFANNDKTEAINNQSNQGGSVFGNDGMDIKYNVIRLKADLTIPEGAFLIIPEGYCLRTADRRLTNYGVIISEGEIIGDVPPLYPISFTAILAGEGSNTMMNATYAGESVLSGAQVSSGETLIVSVSTENTNPHSFEWTKNNIVQDETSNTFTVKNIFGPTALTCTTRVSLSNAVLVIADQAWTGSALTPAVQIELSGEIVALTESKDYVTKYALNIDPGTASVTVVGIGKYTGAATGSFQIIRLPVVPTFVDVAATHVLFERVEWLAAQGITSGYLGANGAEYRPANTVLRSEMATFLYRLAGSPTFNALGSSAFVDVPTTAGYFNAMSWLVEHKITSGYTGANGVEYRPGNNVSRAEMATFLYRLAGSPAFSAPVDSMFVDVSPSAGYYKAVAWLVSTGVTTGYADTAGTQYRPSNSVTRGEMATFLWRMADKELVANF
ncbi:MAG: S-layer homology domain-containing protein [Propionibacteriaceae bacterium]|nr:S-layer homology domain-containing protein [Propionibacteriaceae bacterium]